MLSKGFKIVSPKTFEVHVENVEIGEKEAIVRIDTAAICKADLRYYLGNRDKRTLGLKYPMRLIHEAVGTVLKDPSDTLKVGEKVVLVPNIKTCGPECEVCNSDRLDMGENYCSRAKFVSSNYDGFSCEYLSYPVANLVSISGSLEDNRAVFAELTSVAVAAARKYEDLNNKVIAVWGDGTVGYILSSILKLTTNSTIISVGVNPSKLELFPGDKRYLSGDSNLSQEGIDIAFECVGGASSEKAVNEILDTIKIGGKVVLTGVAENNIAINTRKILEKGITITGTTRSTVEDFKNAVKLIEDDNYGVLLDQLVKEELIVNDIHNYYDAFELESVNRSLGKYILKLNL